MPKARGKAPADGMAATVRVKMHPSPAASGGGTSGPSSRPQYPHPLPSFLFRVSGGSDRSVFQEWAMLLASHQPLVRHTMTVVFGAARARIV